MFCKNCGKAIDDDSVFCPYCGIPLNQNLPKQAPNNFVPQIKDEGGFLWGLLGFIIPLLGLILYLVFKDSKPKTASSVGTGALVGAILFACYAIFMIIIF